MHAIQSLLLIAAFTAFFLMLAVLLCAYAEDVQENDADGLLYVGVLYVGAKDKPVDCYRHTGTNAVYYKMGIQYRNANNGRIVSTGAALNGAY
mgnify:CR=1 FL=1